MATNETRPLHPTRLNFVWDVWNVVGITKEWCVICTKQRMHETYTGWKVCVVCGEQTAPKEQEVEEQVGFQIDKYLKGETQ